jgi:hypothetical protein
LNLAPDQIPHFLPVSASSTTTSSKPETKPEEPTPHLTIPCEVLLAKTHNNRKKTECLMKKMLSYIFLFLVSWGVLEVSLSVYDAYETGKTLADPDASNAQKAIQTGGSVVGLVAPGGGYGTAAKQGAKYAEKELAAKAVSEFAETSFSNAGLKLAFSSGKISKEILESKGGDVLQQMMNKVENILGRLTNLDILGAVKDIRRMPVVKNGRQFDHLDEVNKALKGLGNQIEILNKGIENGKFGGKALEEAQRIRSSLQNEKDRIQNILNKAGHED